MIADRQRYITENHAEGKPLWGWWTLWTEEDLDGTDTAVLCEASRRFTQWACTSEQTRGVLWLDPDDWTARHE